MKDRKKAELQRRLSMSPLHKPPAGLAEKIKRDIPRDLRVTEDERARFMKFNSISLRLAASILILVGGAYFAITMLSEKQRGPAALRTISMPQALPGQQKPANEKQVTVIDKLQPPTKKLDDRYDVARDREEKVKGERDQMAPTLVATRQEPARLPAAAAAAPPPPPAEVAFSDTATGSKDGNAAGGAAPVAQTAVSAPAPAPMMQAEARTMAKSAVIAEAPAMNAAAPATTELFGISVDRGAFDRIKFAIEHGDRPAAGNVDVAALVNYFAGATPHIRRDAALDLEASSRPVRDGKSTALVRVSVDTSSTIYDATLDITFDPMSVSEYHRVGGGNVPTASESVVLANRSVTALYAVELKPNVRARQAVATATLTYRSGEGKQTLTRWVSYGEALQAWKTRTRRHRLATLGAIWGETLVAQAVGADVAKQAEELAKQEPRDEKAQELATLATASSRLRTSSPTGSGR